MFRKSWGVMVLVLGLVLLVSPLVFASHLKVSEAIIGEVNTAKQVAKVQVTVSWDNSWRDEINCDGVWLFAKFKDAHGLLNQCS